MEALSNFLYNWVSSIICFYFSAESSIVKSNIDVLVSNGLGPRAHEDFLLAMNTCNVLLKLVNTQKVSFGSS